MTDPRPSENTDKPFAAVAEYGRTHLGWGRTETPDDDEQYPIADLIERAQNANDPGFGLVLAQLATVQQLRKLTTVAEAAVDTIRGLLAEGADR